MPRNLRQKRQYYRELNQKGGVYRYGIGPALSYRGCSIGAEGVDTSTALIQVNEDGSVNLATSVSEKRSGVCKTAMSLIAAEAFGIPLSELHFYGTADLGYRRRRIDGGNPWDYGRRWGDS